MLKVAPFDETVFASAVKVNANWVPTGEGGDNEGDTMVGNIELMVPLQITYIYIK